MGAGSSSQATDDDEQSTNDESTKSTTIDANVNQVSSLPHKCEDILKHADSPVDWTTTNMLIQKLHAGVFLNQGRQRYWVNKGTNKNCFTVLARDLSIAWAEDNRFWHWPSLQESSDKCLVVAELLNVCWLEVHGKLEVATLSPETLYEVVFLVKLKDPAYGWEVPVNLRLTLPDKSRQEHKENLIEKPRERWIEISVGEFKTSVDNVGEIDFSLYEYEGGKWKRGLLIKGVTIRPKK